MDKCIKWYKRICMLSLFLFMFGILLINICIIGFSFGSNNIAYAGYTTNVSVNDNLIDGYFLDGHSLDTSSSFESGKWFVGTGITLSPSTSGLTVTWSGSGTSYLMYCSDSYPNSSLCLALYATSGNIGSIKFMDYNWSVRNDFGWYGNNTSSSGRVQYYTMVRSGSISGLSAFGIAFESSTSVVLSFIKLEVGTAFTGQPDNSYTPNGYDQGFTDGVNSASGVPGGTDLTNTTWLAPEYNVAGGSWGLYTVSGYVDSISTGSRFDFTVVSISSQPSFIDSYSTAMILYNTPDEDMVPVVEGDLIFFTGGVDSTNSTLISWLNDNNPFLTYTDGYQDGYNVGYDIGYDLGYNAGLLFSDYQHGFDDGFTIGVDVGSQFLFSGYHLIDGNYTSGYVTSEFIADGKKYRGTLTRSSGQTNYLDDSVGTSSLTADGVYYAAYKIGSFTDGFAFSTYVGANAYPNNDVNTNLVYFYVIMLDPLNENYIKVRLVDYSIILNRLRKNLTDYNNYYFKYIFPNDNSYDCYLVYDGYYNNTSIGQYLSAYQLQNFMTYYYDPDTVSDEYNTGVTVGYNEGYLQGNEEGYNSGYADYQAYGEQNYDLGYYNGHMIGYQEGLTNGSTNEYGFHTLLGAVFDVPVQTINGLLDFEILGVNMKGFYLGLISLCIALFILKIVFK